MADMGGGTGCSAVGTGFGQRTLGSTQGLGKYYSNPYELHVYNPTTTHHGIWPYLDNEKEPKEKGAEAAQLEACFAKLDHDHDGHLDLSELRIALSLLTQRYVSTRQAAELQSCSKYGKLSLPEFMLHARNHLAPRDEAERQDILSGLQLAVPDLSEPPKQLVDEEDQRELEAVITAAEQACMLRLDNRTITELASLPRPPSCAEDVVAAVLILLGRRDEAQDWRRISAVLRDRMGLLQDMLEFAQALIRGGVPEASFHDIEPYLNIERLFDPHYVQHACPMALGFATWVSCMHHAFCILTGRPRDSCIAPPGRIAYKDICEACKSLTADDQIEALVKLGLNSDPPKVLVPLFAVVMQIGGIQGAEWRLIQTFLHASNILRFLKMLRNLPADVIRKRIAPFDIGRAKDQLLSIAEDEARLASPVSADLLLWSVGMVTVYEKLHPKTKLYPDP